jgi:tetratricopeptide (TPR) repeat protein
VKGCWLLVVGRNPKFKIMRQRGAIAFSGTLILLGILVLGIFWGKFDPIYPMSSSLAVVPTVVSQSPTRNKSLAPLSDRPSHISLSDRQLQTAQKLVRYLPEPNSYDRLATAYLQKGRETGDFSYTLKAETALDRSLQLDPNNETALKLRAVLLLTYHRFKAALDLTQQLQQGHPHDAQIYAAMTDALVELGDYEAAKVSLQILLDLHPNAPGYARLSYLRALYGDREGAIAAMQKAVQSAHPQDREGLAWYRVHLGNELLNAGRLAEAEWEFDTALQIFPDYHLALAARAKAFFAAGDTDNAIVYYRRALARMPLPEIALALGNLYVHLGNQTAAERQYQLVNFLEQSGGEAFRQAYAHQLAIFWADRETRLDEALALIQQERLTRADIYTLDALAWCLFKLGRLPEAKQAIAQAMRLGTQDARIYYHAGIIYRDCGDKAAAREYLRKALAIDPVFDPLQAAIAKKINAEGNW